MVDKIGLELQFDDYTYTDEQFDAVILESADGVVQLLGEPTYHEIREFLWDDHQPTAVGVVDTDTDPAEFGTGVVFSSMPASAVAYDRTVGQTPLPEECTWFEIEADIEKVTNRTTDLDGYCERYPMLDDENDRCYVHQGGGAPEGNTNAMTHGMRARRTNYWNSLDKQEKMFIEALVDSWLDDAPYDRDNFGKVNELYRAAIDQSRAWGGIDEFVDEFGNREGLVTEQTIRDEDGELQEVEDEHPANMPYSRLDGDIRQKLKEHGIYDDPDSQQAEATMSLAQRISGMGDDGDN